jgi:hypothetical protein
VHLEIVLDMTTSAFLRAFRRFAARRSLPSKMISDNGTTYIAAADQIRELMDSPTVKDFLANRNITWTFIPKRAPWFGGFYERLIGVAKMTLKKVLGRSCVSLDELSTLLTEAEATINDRPITYVSSAQADPVPLTPSQLVNGRMITTLPYELVDADLLNDPDYGQQAHYQKRSKRLELLSEHFWRRWSNEYLLALRERHIASHRPGKTENRIKVGDVVLVHSDNDKRIKWKLAVVQKLNEGNDGLVRSAVIKTNTGITNRPIVKLYPLEVNSDAYSETLPKNGQPLDIPTPAKQQQRLVRKAAAKARDKFKDWAKLLS